MSAIVFLLGIFFVILSTSILSYISMATMIGPWIAPTIVIASSIILKLRRGVFSVAQKSKELAIIQTIGSVGGIVAVGVGFSLPTLYFLDSGLFNKLISNPLEFAAFIAILCIAAGGFGIWLARVFADKFVVKEQLSFPVSKLIYKIITSQSQSKQAKTMFLGFSFAWIISFFRDGILRFKGFLPKVFYIFPSVFGQNFALSVMPMFWAIGFIAGVKIVLPLFIGLLSKYLVIWPINNHFAYLPFKFFNTLPAGDFITAFASGLAVSELILGLLKYPGIVWNKIKNSSGFNYFEKLKTKKLKNGFNLLLNLEFAFVLGISLLFLTYLKFSFVSQVLLLVFIVLATYQISYLAAKLGLVSFGRFATFIMLPMMMIFKLDAIQITMICVFFNVCAATASDLLFDYKVGELCSLDFEKIHKYQWLGLIVTSLTIGFILWILFTHFQLGSSDLFAQRGKSRALLIQSLSFDWKIVLMGFFYGVILKKLKVSPTMVFGGILMPNNLTIGLVVGAIVSYFTKNADERMPFWSGVFAGESIWILFFITLKFFV